MPVVMGRTVGRVGYGMMGLTWRHTPCPQEQAFRAMRCAIEKGMTLFNGGEFYGALDYNSLVLLERYLARYPEDADKITLSVKGAFRDGKADATPEGIRKSLDNILAQLNGRKKLDLFECARRDPNVPLEVTFGVLEKEYIQTGKLGGICLSEVSASTIHEAAKITSIKGVEVELSLFSTDVLHNGIAEACAQYGIPLIAYSPIGKGMLTGEIKSLDDIPRHDIRRLFPRFQPDTFDINLKLVDQIKELATKKGCTPAQLALSWCTALSRRPGMPVIIPIPGATTEERVAENSVQVELTDEEMDLIDETLSKFEIAGHPWTSVHLIPAALCLSVPAPYAEQTVPLVHISNGTLAGVHSSTHDQDFFFRVPYAAPPVGNLRFRRPEPPLGWSNTTVRQADKPGPWCVGNNINLVGFSLNETMGMSEDCLHMNIIRPHAVDNVWSSPLLPVLVWIHGGGWQEGSANDQRYNGTFLVQRSVEMGKPIIFVSFNYRLGLFGAISGRLVTEAGLDNLLLHDQIQAFTWIQENIAHFGGDRSRVTIMGESAGALNIGHHLLAPDRGFFSGAIAESGGPSHTNPLLNETEAEAAFVAALNATGCTGASEPLECLRGVPAEVIQTASLAMPLGLVQDGELILGPGSRLLEQGRFIKVPLLIGTNRNEGTGLARLDISGIGPVNNFEDFVELVASNVRGRALPNQDVRRLWDLYQDEVDNPSSAGLASVVADTGPSLGSAYGKATLWRGDSFFNAGRRFSNQIWADHQVPSYSYFFDTITAYLSPELDGAAHFQEIPYVFGNRYAVGWEEDPFPADPSLRAKHLALAEAMSSMWISFATEGTPNNHKGK
ncbi:hypothetical protein F66182_985 [Fusarium sp. NRRL 66182]|nr:hypothetical protein F66182_985 [Fusarium sp. NRRL 66182]